MRGAILAKPWFYPTVLITFVIGNALDLIGTYVSQPNFENEANWIYVTLKPYGLRLTWPLVVTGKILLSVFVAAILAVFLKTRQQYYPSAGGGFREFFTHFFYTRSLSWWQTNYTIPRIKPVFLYAFFYLSLGGAYFAVLGYENLAVKYSWWWWGGVWLGNYWLGWSIVAYALLAIPLSLWLLFEDYRKLDVHCDQAPQ